MTEHDAADEEHLRQVAQTEFVAQPPEHHERDDVGWVLRPVQQAFTALVELLGAVATAKPAVTLCGPFAPFRNGRRATSNTPHLSRTPAVGRLYPARFHLNRILWRESWQNPPLFLPVEMASALSLPPPSEQIEPSRPRRIEIELNDGCRIKIDEGVGLASLRRVLMALRG